MVKSAADGAGQEGREAPERDYRRWVGVQSQQDRGHVEIDVEYLAFLEGAARPRWKDGVTPVTKHASCLPKKTMGHCKGYSGNSRSMARYALA